MPFSLRGLGADFEESQDLLRSHFDSIYTLPLGKTVLGAQTSGEGLLSSSLFHTFGFVVKQHRVYTQMMLPMYWYILDQFFGQNWEDRNGRDSSKNPQTVFGTSQSVLSLGTSVVFVCFE